MHYRLTCLVLFACLLAGCTLPSQQAKRPGRQCPLRQRRSLRRRRPRCAPGAVLIESSNGQRVELAPSRVRRIEKGVYEMYYVQAHQLFQATSADGISFTTQGLPLASLAELFPGYSALLDFFVLDLGDGRAMLSLTYLDADKLPHIAAAPSK